MQEDDQPFMNPGLDRSRLQLRAIGQRGDCPALVGAVFESGASGCGFPEHALIHVPGKKELDAGTQCFLLRVFDYFGPVGAATVRCIWQFDFASE